MNFKRARTKTKKKVAYSIDAELLIQFDAYAKERSLKKSNVVEILLKDLISKQQK